MDDIEHRIEEAIDELRSKAPYWKRLGYRTIDELKRLRLSEAALTQRVSELEAKLAQSKKEAHTDAYI